MDITEWKVIIHSSSSHHQPVIEIFCLNGIWLVVSTPLKNMKVNGNDYPIYYGKYKIFETTNQGFNMGLITYNMGFHRILKASNPSNIWELMRVNMNSWDRLSDLFITN